MIKPELFDCRYNLTEPRIAELTGNGRCGNSVNLVSGVVFAFFENVDNVEHKGFINHSAERALINARAALNAAVVVNMRRFIFTAVNGFYFAGIFARAFPVDNRSIRANL